MKAISIKQLTNGLWLSGANDSLPEGFMRRYRCVSPIALSSIVSQDGADEIASLASNPAHSLVYFSSGWFYGQTTSFYSVASGSLKSGLSGNRLSFAFMGPTAGKVDYLFVAGGGELFKVDSTDTVSNWGIEPPASSGAVFTDGGSGGS